MKFRTLTIMEQTVDAASPNDAEEQIVSRLIDDESNGWFRVCKIDEAIEPDK